MKTLYQLIVFCVIVFGCGQQNSDLKKITGNYVLANGQEDLKDYLELYINKDRIYTYSSPAGLSATHYRLENKTFWVKELENGSWIENGRLFIEKNNLVLEKNGDAIYFSIVEDENTLGRFVNNEISEESYITAYVKRAENYFKE